MPPIPLDVLEYTKESVTFHAAEPHDVECIALEPDGTLWLWNSEGRGVKVPSPAHRVLLHLVLQRYLPPHELMAVLERCTCAPEDTERVA